MLPQEAVEQAVDACIQQDILAQILRKDRSEIVNSILTEWDEDEYRDYLKEEGIKIGKERGRTEGEIKRTIEMCQEFHVSREDTLERIRKEFFLEEAEVEKYMEEYWKQSI